MLEVVGSVVALDDGAEVDVQDAGVAIGAGALGPLEVGGAALDGQVLLDFAASADDAAG